MNFSKTRKEKPNTTRHNLVLWESLKDQKVSGSMQATTVLQLVIAWKWNTAKVLVTTQMIVTTQICRPLWKTPTTIERATKMLCMNKFTFWAQSPQFSLSSKVSWLLLSFSYRSPSSLLDLVSLLLLSSALSSLSCFPYTGFSKFTKLWVDHFLIWENAPGVSQVRL